MKYIFAIFVTCISSVVWATYPCSVDHGYPEVSDVAVTDRGTVIKLGRYYDGYRKSGENSIQLVLTSEGWQRLDEPIAMPTTIRNADCPVKPKFPTEQEQATWYWKGTPKVPDAEFNQQLVGCVLVGDETWSGTSWYGGEGSWGIGGLISFNALTQETDGYYKWDLRKHSVSHLEYFDEQLWIGTTRNGECEEPSPGFGVKRYPLAGEKPVPMRLTDFKQTIRPRGFRALEEPRICGFAVRDMLVIDDDLWIATELGLSVIQINDGGLEFHNYVPDLTSDFMMREVTCDDLYTELLESPRSITDKGFNIGIMFDRFWTRLSTHRPGFVKRHLMRLHGHDVPADSTE